MGHIMSMIGLVFIKQQPSSL